MDTRLFEMVKGSEREKGLGVKEGIREEGKKGRRASYKNTMGSVASG